MIARVLANTGATVQARGMVFLAVDQLVLLYSSESWVVAWAMIKVLEGFHHQVARRITEMTATCAA